MELAPDGLGLPAFALTLVPGIDPKIGSEYAGTVGLRGIGLFATEASHGP